MKLNVLIVDDDESVVFLHRVMVTENNFSGNPVILKNGQETLDYLLENVESSAAYLLLLDINMPLMTGWELLDKINEISFLNTVYVVMVTSSIDMADHEKASTYKQVIGYVEKPINSEALAVLKELQEIRNYFYLPENKT